MTVERLARCRLVFVSGAPPETETGTLLLYTGGCNPQVGYWRDGTLIEWNTRIEIALADVDCWMRMPHPSIWPWVEDAPEAVSEADLYSGKFSAFGEMAG